jgi:hypothetical protein
VGEEGSLCLFLSHDQERQHPSSEVADMYFHIPLSDLTFSCEVMHKRHGAWSARRDERDERSGETGEESWRLEERPFDRTFRRGVRLPSAVSSGRTEAHSKSSGRVAQALRLEAEFRFQVSVFRFQVLPSIFLFPDT